MEGVGAVLASWPWPTILSFIGVVVLGGIGGFVNAILTNSIVMPYAIEIDNGARKVWMLGVYGNIIIGSAAAFTFWASGLANPAMPQALGTAVISGISGARILDNMIRSQIVADSLAAAADELAEDIEES